MQDCFDDDIITFLRKTAIGEKRADRFIWWKTNDHRHPHIDILARDILSIQTSSVTSEEVFSEAGRVMTARRGRLSDDSISSWMLVREWARLLRHWASSRFAG